MKLLNAFNPTIVLPARLRHGSLSTAAIVGFLCIAAAVSAGCATVSEAPLTESRITNDSDTAIDVKLVFDMARVFGWEQPESAEVQQRLEAFAVGEGLEVLSIEPGLLMNSPNKAIAGTYRIQPAGYMIVDASPGTEPDFEFDEMTVTTHGAIMGHHTRESVRQEFKPGDANRYEFKVGTPDAPAAPSHLTQNDFKAKLNEARVSLVDDGLKVVAEDQGTLSAGASQTKNLPSLDPGWIHYALVIGDGSFMHLDLHDQKKNPVFVFEREIYGDPSGPAAAFAPSSNPGYTVTVGMDDCPAAACNYALLVVQGVHPTPPQYPPLDMSEITVGPDNTISWEHAKTMIQRGNVEYVYQSHSRQVRISLTNGERYQTTEREIDDVIRWVEECGKKDWIPVMIE